MRSPNNGGRRNRNRSGRRPQQANRNTVFESNGPEVKVRGNAAQIYEKYTTLARDASSAGDLVRAEGLLQHAEHYLRIVNTQKPAERAPNTNNRDGSPNEESDPSEQPQPQQATASEGSDQDAPREEVAEQPQDQPRIRERKRAPAKEPREPRERKPRRRRDEAAEATPPQPAVVDPAESEQPAIEVISEDPQPAVIDAGLPDEQAA